MVYLLVSVLFLELQVFSFIFDTYVVHFTLFIFEGE